MRYPVPIENTILWFKTILNVDVIPINSEFKKAIELILTQSRVEIKLLLRDLNKNTTTKEIETLFANMNNALLDRPYKFILNHEVDMVSISPNNLLHIYILVCVIKNKSKEAIDNYSRLKKGSYSIIINEINKIINLEVNNRSGINSKDTVIYKGYFVRPSELKISTLYFSIDSNHTVKLKSTNNTYRGQAYEKAEINHIKIEVNAVNEGDNDIFTLHFHKSNTGRNYTYWEGVYSGYGKNDSQPICGKIIAIPLTTNKTFEDYIAQDYDNYDDWYKILKNDKEVNSDYQEDIDNFWRSNKFISNNEHLYSILYNDRISNDFINKSFYIYKLDSKRYVIWKNLVKLNSNFIFELTVQAENAKNPIQYSGIYKFIKENILVMISDEQDRSNITNFVYFINTNIVGNSPLYTGIRVALEKGVKLLSSRILIQLANEVSSSPEVLNHLPAIKDTNGRSENSKIQEIIKNRSFENIINYLQGDENNLFVISSKPKIKHNIDYRDLFISHIINNANSENYNIDIVLEYIDRAWFHGLIQYDDLEKKVLSKITTNVAEMVCEEITIFEVKGIKFYFLKTENRR